MLQILTPIWADKTETARKVRRRIGAVMEWAMARGYRADNPAGNALRSVLPKMPSVLEHHPAVHYRDVYAAIRAVRQSDAWPVTRLSFEFLVLTASRSSEMRLATWDEIDWDNATWTVAAERMKGRQGQRREHRVPLASRTMSLLNPNPPKEGVGAVS